MIWFEESFDSNVLHKTGKYKNIIVRHETLQFLAVKHHYYLDIILNRKNCIFL